MGYGSRTSPKLWSHGLLNEGSCEPCRSDSHTLDTLLERLTSEKKGLNDGHSSPGFLHRPTRENSWATPPHQRNHSKRETGFRSNRSAHFTRQSSVLTSDLVASHGGSLHGCRGQANGILSEAKGRVRLEGSKGLAPAKIGDQGEKVASRKLLGVLACYSQLCTVQLLTLGF